MADSQNSQSEKDAAKEAKRQQEALAADAKAAAEKEAKDKVDAAATEKKAAEEAEKEAKAELKEAKKGSSQKISDEEIKKTVDDLDVSTAIKDVIAVELKSGKSPTLDAVNESSSE